MLLQITRGVAFAALLLGISGLYAGFAGIAWALLAIVGIYLAGSLIIEVVRWWCPQPQPPWEE